MKSRFTTLLALTATASVSHAGIFVQELFDNISTGNASLNGAGSTTTTVGLSGTWATNGSTAINTANNFNVNGVNGELLPGLPSDGGAPGGVWNATGGYGTSIFATRPLVTPISFATDRTIYFSVRLNNPGDTSMGVGLASGNELTSDFVGAGFTWNNAVPIAGGGNIAGNSPYISYGKLDGAQQNGVYGIRAFEPGKLVNGPGLLVGRIKISATGDDEIHIKRYAPGQTIDDNLTAIVWSASSTVNTSMNATHLLLWMNGTGSGELDAIRFGDTWTDVTGVTLAANEQPALTSAAVTNVTLTGAQASANLFTSPGQVTLYWDTFDQGTDAGAWSSSLSLGTQAIGPVSGAITGLSADTRYYYRFRAVNTNPEPDLEGWSENGRYFDTPLTGLAVDDLFAEAQSAYAVDLYWSDVFYTETGYVIERSLSGANEWTTVATLPANTGQYTDTASGLQPNTAYEYRISATHPVGGSNLSNVVAVTTDDVSPFQTKLLINFDGTLDGNFYTLGEGEIDETSSFKANGAPTVSNGVARLNPGVDNGPDGFDANPSMLGDLRAQNWIAEAVVTYNSVNSTTTTPWLIDVQGDTNLRLRSETSADVLQLFYYNGSAVQRSLSPLPPSGVKAHFALVWDAATTTLTGYVNGELIGQLSNGPFARPDVTNLSFGYLGRTNFVGNGIDGTLDAVSFQTGTGLFDPGSNFIIMPETQGYAAWIAGYNVGALTGFEDDADGDGLSNGLEALLGTNPSTANASALTQVTSNGTTTSFFHTLASNAISDVAASYEWSPNLTDWYAADGVAGPAGGATVNATTTPAAGGVTVTATSSSPMTKAFIRLKASQILAD
ncbi:fibronectin type III domain-containing protein [Luteolibacter flavescens]|uniref:Fibronectin type III domain-containing protein n=1 Tax=Luteolibacter flavescens TaxID=1859460 RepID=A0ABT3FTN2_9BACT|nr:fibronectin type III domain-containing protein [Luteolibacter flavescens]MCW1886345.1 fibronectin type III domain-containing protein [Luteolibacter flavescens]